MPNNPRRAKGGGWAVLAVVVLIALPVLYVASIGPVYRIASYDENGLTNTEALHRLDSIYAPVWWASKYCKPVKGLLLRYIGIEDLARGLPHARPAAP
jgi:hypothetical protein